MTSAREYFDTLKTARDAIGTKMGVIIPGADFSLRVVADADLAVVGILAKRLVDSGAFTDAQLQSAIAAAVNGTDGSTWTDDPSGGGVDPGTGNPFDNFPGESFETGTSGAAADASNTAFTRGPVGDSLLSSNGTMTFDSSTAAVGTKSLRTFTRDGWSRALRTDTYTTTSTLYARFYFRATAATPASASTIFATMLNPASGSGLGGDIPEAFTLGIEATTGKVFMFDQAASLGGSTSNVCNGSWWRIEAAISGTTATVRLYTGANLTGTTINETFSGTYSATPVNSAMIGQPGSRMSSGQTWTTWHDKTAFSTSGWVGP